MKLKRENWKLLVKAVLVAGTIIYILINGLFWLSSLLTRFLGLPPSFSSPILKVGGWALLFAGAAVALWLMKYRSPTDMIVSTYFTFVKMFTRVPVSDVGGRTEHLIIEGPQKYVRHPLYLSAVLTFLGWAFVTDSTSSVLGVIFILFWYAFVQIPFEEKELRAVFGDQYARYAKNVPMMIPFTKRQSQRLREGFK
ncbi:MAG TPA: isoprenylcysteine carboxylmethyltransferase family protein [Nitrososphaerales archaeon]|nr:isoprenylcysteine carboxylmethyltransferase family protein [Nitrososphaerales archaeon]